MHPPHIPPSTEKALENLRWMSALANRLARGASEADDLVQETWLAYFEKPPREDRATGSWLRTVLRNFALRSRRSDGRRREREELNARPEAQPSDPGALVERAEMLQRISQHVLRLDEPNRSTVLLRYFEDLSPSEIARRQGVPVKTVHTRLRRSIEELRERLDRDHGGDRSRWLAALAPLPTAPLALHGSASGSAAGTSTSTPWFGHLALGGITLASKKIGLAALISACLFLAAGGWLVWSSSASRDPATGERSVAAGSIERAAREERDAKPDASRPQDTPETAATSSIAVTPAGPLLRGRVVDEKKNGIADAIVVAVPVVAWEAQADAELRALGKLGDGDLSDELAAVYRKLRNAAGALPRARTGKDGAFAFEPLPDGEHRVLASRDGYLPSTKLIALVSSPEITTVELKLAPARAIHGRVLDEEKRPVAGARVSSRPVTWRRLGDQGRQEKVSSLLGDASFLAESNEAESGADGSFVLSSLEPGLHDLRAEKSGRAGGALYDVSAGSSVELLLESGVTVSGTVVGPDRKPEAGADVTLGAASGSARPASAVGEPNSVAVSADVIFGDERAVRATTDASGRFELVGAVPAVHRLAVAQRGFPTRSLDVDAHKSIDLGIIQLEAGGAIAGIVVDAEGAPVGGARVWIEDAPPNGVSEWGGRFYSTDALAETRTREDGLFRLERLGGGAHAVRVASALFVERVVSGIRAGRDDLRIELSKGFVQRGRVVDGATGFALSGARVVLLEGLWRLAASEKSTSTRPDGSFELRGLARGDDRLTVEATHPDDTDAKASLELQRDGREVDVELRLFSPERLPGRVVDAAGLPVAMARVTCTLERAQPRRSAKDGSFTLTLPRSRSGSYPGWIEVVASHSTLGSGRAIVEIPEAGHPLPELTIPIRAGSSLKGRVKSWSGEPLSGAHVEAWLLHGSEGFRGVLTERAYSRDDGAFSFPALEEGTYQLECHAPGFVRRVASNLEVAPGTPDQEIVLEPARKLGGRVVDQEGRAVRLADVVAFEAIDSDGASDFGSSGSRWNRRHLEPGIASAKTDATGAYELRDLPTGRLTIAARATDHEPSELQVIAPDGSPEDLVVSTLGAIRGRVEDAIDGQPLSPFKVALEKKSQEGDASRAMIPREYDDSAGAFLFDALPAGRYAVVVVVDGRPVSGQWIDVRPGEETRARFAVEAGATLTGVVRDADGAVPLAGVQVRAFHLSGWEQQLMLPTPCVWSGADGSFRVDGLPDGPYKVGAFLQGYSSKQKAVQIDPAVETAPVLLELRKSGGLSGRLTNLSKRRVIWSRLVLQRIDETGHGEKTHPLDERKDDFSADGFPPGRYEVQLREHIPGPNIAPDATAFKTEDLIERILDLGEVEIRAGEMSRLDATLPPSPADGK